MGRSRTRAADFPLRYVNLWPKPLQKPFPPVWIPGSRSPSTMTEVAKRGYCYFLSRRAVTAARPIARNRSLPRCWKSTATSIIRFASAS